MKDIEKLEEIVNKLNDVELDPKTKIKMMLEGFKLVKNSKEIKQAMKENLRKKKIKNDSN